MQLVLISDVYGHSIALLFCGRLLQTIDIRILYDKFPSGKGGLKDLYDRGPQSAFFLVKFWVCSISQFDFITNKKASLMLFKRTKYV